MSVEHRTRNTVISEPTAANSQCRRGPFPESHALAQQLQSCPSKMPLEFSPIVFQMQPSRRAPGPAAKSRPRLSHISPEKTLGTGARFDVLALPGDWLAPPAVFFQPSTLFWDGVALPPQFVLTLLIEGVWISQSDFWPDHRSSGSVVNAVTRKCLPQEREEQMRCQWRLPDATRRLSVRQPWHSIAAARTA